MISAPPPTFTQDPVANLVVRGYLSPSWALSPSEAKFQAQAGKYGAEETGYHLLQRWASMAGDLDPWPDLTPRLCCRPQHKTANNRLRPPGLSNRLARLDPRKVPKMDRRTTTTRRRLFILPSFCNPRDDQHPHLLPDEIGDVFCAALQGGAKDQGFEQGVFQQGYCSYWSQHV